MNERSRRRLRRIGGAAVAVSLGLAALWWIRRPAESPELRGFHLAGRLGCFGCHGPGGTGGVPNPGSEEGEIPSWTGGTLMMYVNDDAEIAEWIRFGRPRRLRRPGDPEVASAARTPPIRMPGYEGRVMHRGIDDLVAYIKTVGGRAVPPPGPAREGYRVAARLGCFGCHGSAGRVGSPNPGSFKGVVPGWTGPDFRELVRNDDELRAWILDGGIPRLERNPVARWFIDRQVIRMPAYRTLVRKAELDAIIAYVRWLSPR